MLKKIFKIILILMLAAIFTSCQKENNENDYLKAEKEKETAMLKEKSENSKNDILVAYFSLNDSISDDAYIIKDYLFADLMEIKAQEPYTNDDDTNRPTIANNIKNLDKYKYIFVGFPIWQEKMPNIIYSFLEKFNFKDKYIYPFTKSNDEQLLYNIREEILNLTSSNDTYIYPVKYIANGEFVDNITSWIDSLNLKTEFDEGLIPVETKREETEEPDLSEARSID